MAVISARWFVSRYFLADLGLRRSHGALAVRPVSAGSSQIADGRFRGTFVQLQRARRQDVLRAAGEGGGGFV